MKYIFRGSSKLTMYSWAKKSLIQKKEESICRAYFVVIIVTFWCEKWEKKEKWLICQDVEQHKSSKANSSISLKKGVCQDSYKTKHIALCSYFGPPNTNYLSKKEQHYFKSFFPNFQLLIRRFVMVMHRWEL